METLGRHGARAKELRRRLRQRRSGEVIVDGGRLVDDLVRWGLPIAELYLTPQHATSHRGRSWIAASDASFLVDEVLLGSLASTRNPQGVLAVTTEPEAPPWLGERGLALILDAVQDPGNVGAIVRSAAALGAAAVLLTPGCADPYHPTAVRGSAGAVLRLPITREISVAEVAERVSGQGGELWIADRDGVDLAHWAPTEPTALVLGAEGGGIGRAARELACGVVTIPLQREVESLNVAVAAALLIDAWKRR